MTEQEENQLICEKLLRWKRSGFRGPIWYWLPTPYGDDGAQWHEVTTPAFTTWEDAGLILDALAAKWPASKVFFRGLGGSMILGGLTAPEVRAAALEYIRAAGEV